MSVAKRVMEERQELTFLAVDLLKQAKLLIECPRHSGTYYDAGDDDLQAAYKLANSRITSGEISLPAGIGRREFTDIIKETYIDNSGIDYCVSCEKAMRD